MPKLPMSGGEVLDRYFLEVRAKLLEIGATLDRIDRAEKGSEVAKDPRRQKVDQGLDILRKATGDRAEKLQLLFSRDYAETWIDDFEPAQKLRQASR
jgi:hypothetical protein